MLTTVAERDVDTARGPVSSSVVSGQAATSGHLARLGAVAAVVGALVLFASTMLHPSNADPGHAPAAFSEYATDTLWVWSHIGQFAGIAALGAALVVLAATLEPGRASNWGRVAAALQAVDGVALKSMVDRWAAATGQEQRIALRRLLPYGRSRSGWPA